MAPPLGKNSRGSVKSYRGIFSLPWLLIIKTASQSGRGRMETGAKMDMWERMGYDSFGAWRRASEKARRAAKKAAPPAPPAASTASKWHPPQITGGEIWPANSILIVPAPTLFASANKAGAGGW